jgi:predicted GNAT family acetyltransferase
VPAKYRRRGYAGVVIRALLDRFFTAGGEIAWLTPGDAGAERLYTNLGFVPTATQLNMAVAGT